jgi:catechol 2,3-dioxygenase-like lactoylglutathione lyase family enzyme
LTLRVWYRVSDLDAGRALYTETLGFVETGFDHGAGVSELERGEMKIGLTETDPGAEGVASIDVSDVRAEADRLRAAGLEVGTILELHGAMRLCDVYDPDGNRIQLQQEL